MAPASCVMKGKGDGWVCNCSPAHCLSKLHIIVCLLLVAMSLTAMWKSPYFAFIKYGGTGFLCGWVWSREEGGSCPAMSGGLENISGIIV